jgi:hypothetical protein
LRVIWSQGSAKRDRTIGNDLHGYGKRLVAGLAHFDLVETCVKLQLAAEVTDGAGVNAINVDLRIASGFYVQADNSGVWFGLFIS